MQVICPLCRLSLNNDGTSWRCENNHSFDIAKQGYCNLLPVQHKKSLQPGDSAEMVSARTRFLNLGFYQNIASTINNTLINFIDKKNIQHPIIIDAGCGEGYYTNSLFNALNDHSIKSKIAGIDISKFAILASAKRNKNINWFVANSSHIPIENHSADILISLFSPLPSNEFYRCLKPGGLLMVASTGNNHLIELRQHLYETVNEQCFDPSTALGNDFSLDKQQGISETISLTSNRDIKDLFAMTPHYWRVSPDKKIILNDLHHMAVSIDIRLHSFIVRSVQ